MINHVLELYDLNISEVRFNLERWTLIFLGSKRGDDVLENVLWSNGHWSNYTKVFYILLVR